MFGSLFGLCVRGEITTHRKAQADPAREGKLDVLAELVVPATLFCSGSSARPGDARGCTTLIRVEGIRILGQTGDWGCGSV